MGRLDGKTALITGGGRGIGKGIARRFAAEGARLVLAQRGAAELDGTVREIEAAGGSALGISADVSRPDDVRRLVEQAGAALGQIDILANNAARTGRIGSFLDVTLDDWSSYIGTNLTGAFMVAQAVARQMVSAGVAGRIINTGSVDSFASEPQAAPYAASKGGIWLLTRAMATDLAPHGIVVNMLAPGAIEVERTAAKYASSDLVDALQQAVPLGARGHVDDVAAAAVYLASDECRYMTGSAITIDGGLMAKLAL